VSYLELLQTFCAKWNLPVPNTVASPDPQVRQLVALFLEVVEDLRERPFQQLRRRVNWTSIAGTDQGDIGILWSPSQSPNPGAYSYSSLIRCTLWDLTSRRPLIGPVSDADWQLLQANPAPGPSFFYRIDSNRLLVWPAMSAGISLSVLVLNRAMVYDPTVPTYKVAPTLDTDIFLLEDNLLRMELEWRWLKQKGEPWLATYEEAAGMRAQQLDKDGSMPTLSLTPQQPVIRPGVWVPAGSWNV
jgi:hypothetical protein